MFTVAKLKKFAILGGQVVAIMAIYNRVAPAKVKSIVAGGK